MAHWYSYKRHPLHHLVKRDCTTADSPKRRRRERATRPNLAGNLFAWPRRFLFPQCFVVPTPVSSCSTVAQIDLQITQLPLSQSFFGSMCSHVAIPPLAPRRCVQWMHLRGNNTNCATFFNNQCRFCEREVATVPAASSGLPRALDEFEKPANVII
jgi:hypothetical protein